MVVLSGTVAPRGTLTKAAVGGVADFDGNGLGADSVLGGTFRWDFSVPGLSPVSSQVITVEPAAVVTTGQIKQYLTFFLDDTHTVDGVVVTGIPTISQTTCSTDPNHARPFMMMVLEGVDTSVDLVEASVAIGSIQLSVQDNRRTAAQQTGWFTFLLADAGGKTALMGQRVSFKQIDQFGQEYNVDLLIQDIKDWKEKTGFTITTRDMRERERTMGLFYRAEESVIWPSPLLGPDNTGVRDGYGRRNPADPASTPILAPSRGARATWKMNGYDAAVPAGRFDFVDQPWVDVIPEGPTDWMTLVGQYNLITPGIYDPTVAATAQGSRKMTSQLTGMTVQWRPWGSTGAWIELRNSPIWEVHISANNLTAGQWGFYYFKSKSNSKGLQWEMAGIIIGGNNFTEIPTANQDVEVRVLSGKPPTPEAPIYFEGTYGAFLKRCYDGYYSVQPTGLRYNTAVMNDLVVNSPIMRLIQGETVKEGLNWLQENWYKPMRMIPLINAAGEIVPTSYEVPDATVTLVTLDNTNVETADWSHGVGDAVTGVNFMYKRDYVGSDNKIHTIDVHVDKLDAPGVTRAGDRTVKFEPQTVREVTADVAAAYGQAGGLAAEYGYYLAQRIQTALIDRFSLGGQHCMVTALRSDASVRGLLGGQWVIMAVTWLPDYVTKVRGINRLMQVIDVKDTDPNVRHLELVDAGPYQQPLPIPVLTNLTLTLDQTAVKVVAGRIPANVFLRVDVATNPTQPGPADPAWMMVGRKRGGLNYIRDSDNQTTSNWSKSTTNTLNGVGLNGHTASQITDNNVATFQSTVQSVAIVADTSWHTGFALVKKDTDQSRIPIIRFALGGGTVQGIDVAFNTATGAFLVRNIQPGSVYVGSVTLSPDGVWWVIRLSTQNNSTNTQATITVYPAVMLGGDPTALYALNGVGSVTMGRMGIAAYSDSVPTEIYDEAYKTFATAPVTTQTIQSGALAAGVAFVRARYEQEGRRPSAWLQVGSVTVPSLLLAGMLLEINPDGTVTATWRQEAGVLGLRFYYGVYNPATVSPPAGSIAGFVDVSAVLGTYTFPIKLKQFQRLIVDAVAYPGWSGAAVFGSPGQLQRLPEAAREDDNLILPEMQEQTSETATTGFLQLVPYDPSGLIHSVETQTYQGLGLVHDWVVVVPDSSGNYLDNVPLANQQVSIISYRIRIYQADGTLVYMKSKPIRYAIGGKPLPPQLSYQPTADGLLAVTVVGDSSTTGNRVAISLDSPVSLDVLEGVVTAPAGVILSGYLLGRSATFPFGSTLLPGQKYYVTAVSYNTNLGGTVRSQGSDLIWQTDQWIGPSNSQAKVRIASHVSGPKSISLAVVMSPQATECDLYVREYRVDPGAPFRVDKTGYKLKGINASETVEVPVAQPLNYVIVTALARDALNRIGTEQAYAEGIDSHAVSVKLQAAAGTAVVPNPPTALTATPSGVNVSLSITLPGTVLPDTLRIKRDGIIIAEVAVSVGAGGVQAYADNGLSPGTYQYEVWGLKAGISSASPSPTANATVVVIVIDTPSMAVGAYDRPNQGYQVTVTPGLNTPPGVTYILERRVTNHDGLGNVTTIGPWTVVNNQNIASWFQTASSGSLNYTTHELRVSTSKAGYTTSGTSAVVTRNVPNVNGVGPP